MANENDSRIIETMMRLPGELLADFFSQNAHSIIDDATYWNVLGTLWKLGGTVRQQELWVPLFLSPRPKREKVMKRTERKRWRRLPPVVTAFRAINEPSEADTAISWSLNRNVVDRFFTEHGKRPIVERQFKKPEIFAFFDRRGEEEILVNIARQEEVK